jgi:2-keto-4-pentenoate hydratase
MDRVTAACEYLLEMRRTRRPVAALPADVVPRSLAEGYQVQERLVRTLLDRSGGHPIGYKVACTSELAQKALGVDGPFFGVLLSHCTYRSAAALPASDFTVRCAEAEFGFEMAADVPPGPAYTAETITDYIAAALPSIEIVDHRYHDWHAVGAPSLLADNAIHGAWVAGNPYPGWRDLDFALHPVALLVNGEQTFPGSGAAVLGNPLTVVAWLANELPRFGRRLRRGDRVTTGVTTGIYLAQPGDRLAADFGPLGRVELDFGRS